MNFRKLYFLIGLMSLLMACEDSDDNGNVITQSEIGIFVLQEVVSEDVGTFQLRFATPIAFEMPVTITYEVSGEATSDTDFIALPGTITLPAGSLEVLQEVTIIDDTEVEASETITVQVLETDVDAFISGSDSVSVTISDNDSFPFAEGFLVVNEGNFGQGNTSISFVSADLQTATNTIFQDTNSELLGDVAQSIGFYNNWAFIVVNNSNKIEIVHRYTFESVATVSTGLLNPRYIAFANNTAYITNWGDGFDPNDDYVAMLDLDSFTITGTISVAEGPEAILAVNNQLFVAHQGGFSQNNKVSVIDASNQTVNQVLTVGDVPNSLVVDPQDNVWVLCGGNPAFTGAETAGALYKITPSFTVSQEVVFPLTDHPSYLNINENDLYFYTQNGAVFKTNTTSPILPTNSEISDVNWYRMRLANGYILGSDAGNFTSAGTLIAYNLLDNSLVGTATVGIIPGEIYFND